MEGMADVLQVPNRAAMFVLTKEAAARPSE
jgi:hypothetical protein